MFPKFFRYQSPAATDTGGTDTAAERELTPFERGDVLEDDTPTEKETAAPADEKSAAELETEIAAEKEKTEGKKDARIPLDRHEAVLKREREKREDLERQLAQYQRGDELSTMNADLTAAENAVIELEKKYTQELADGEIEKAAAIMQQIRKTEREMNEAKSDMKIHAAEVRATERARYNTTLDRVESAFPTLNPDHEDFDQEVMAEVVELKDAYQLKGFTPTVALQKAVKALVEPRTTRQEIATSTKPQVTARDVAAERRADAVGKTSRAVAKAPPSLANTGTDSGKMGGVSAASVMSMSQKEFSKLSDEELSRMRGDTL